MLGILLLIQFIVCERSFVMVYISTNGLADYHLLYKMTATVRTSMDMTVVYGILEKVGKTVNRLLDQKEPFLWHLFNLIDQIIT